MACRERTVMSGSRMVSEASADLRAGGFSSPAEPFYSARLATSWPKRASAPTLNSEAVTVFAIRNSASLNPACLVVDQEDGVKKPSEKSATPNRRQPTAPNVPPKGSNEHTNTGPLSSGLTQQTPGAPLVAAKGDDDLMSQPATGIPPPRVDRVKGDTSSRFKKPVRR